MPASVRAKGAAGAAILLSEICLELKADVQEGIEGIGIVVLRVFREAVCLSHARLVKVVAVLLVTTGCLLYTSPSPRDA